jgi:hypothetical protein
LQRDFTPHGEQHGEQASTVRVRNRFAALAPDTSDDSDAGQEGDDDDQK